jgi:hypothetical protein
MLPARDSSERAMAENEAIEIGLQPSELVLSGGPVEVRLMLDRFHSVEA